MKAWFVVLAAAVLLAAAPGDAASPNIARELGNSFADAVEKVMPSVVVIRTEATVVHAVRDMFFGRAYGIPERLAGQGSGVIISEDGYVLTSHHVIADADQMEVVLHDGTKYPAERVGRDPQTDLAVVRITAPAGTKFRPIEPGDSDSLRVGEFVIAVGSPFSLQSSVSAGIVSQKGRTMGLLPYEDFIQTDAPINPGNSGGPLVDVDGRMVGINAMIQSAGMSPGSIGIGFAVPVNMAMRVARSLIETGTVERPWIGILPQDLSPALAAGLVGEKGVLVAEVIENTPAARVGLLQGDIITKVDDHPVDGARALQRAVLDHRPGDKVKLTVRRVGKEFVLEPVTERMPQFGMVER